MYYSDYPDAPATVRVGTSAQHLSPIKEIGLCASSNEPTTVPFTVTIPVSVDSTACTTAPPAIASPASTDSNAMSSGQVVVFVTLVVESKHLSTASNLLGQLITASRAEPGCLTYDLHTEIDTPNSFVLHEVWESEAALEEHRTMAHYLIIVPKLGEHVSSMVIRRTTRNP